MHIDQQLSGRQLPDCALTDLAGEFTFTDFRYPQGEELFAACTHTDL